LDDEDTSIFCKSKLSSDKSKVINSEILIAALKTCNGLSLILKRKFEKSICFKRKVFIQKYKNITQFGFKYI
jgi:hypothetical protein